MTVQMVKFAVDSKGLTAAQEEALLGHAGASRAIWNYWHSIIRDRDVFVEEFVRDLSLSESKQDADKAFELRRDKTWQVSAYEKARQSAVSTFLPETLPQYVSATGKLSLPSGGLNQGTWLRNVLKNSPPEHMQWWYGEKHGYHSTLLNYSVDDYGKAYSKFIKDRSKNAGRRRKDGSLVGYPRFKSKHRDQPAFAMTSLTTNPVVSAHRVKLPSIGTIRVSNHTKKLQRLVSLGATYACKTIRVYRSGGRWYIVFTIVTEDVSTTPTRAMRANGAVGLDQGVTKRAVLSDGTVIANPKHLKNAERRLKHAQRAVSRKRSHMAKGQAGSANYAKAKERLAKIHREVSSARDGYLHRVTQELASSYSFISIEDLATANMTRRAKGKNVRQKAGLNRSILDASFSDFVAKLSYKTERSGAELVKVPAAYTSQKCNKCGHTAKENRESQAVFKCKSCGHAENADLNAAKNIRDAGLSKSARPVMTGSINGSGESHRTS